MEKRTAWNKGKNFSAETRLKMSLAKKGKRPSCSFTKGSQRRENNSNYRGGKLIPCVVCGKETWRKPSELKKGSKYCSFKCSTISRIGTKQSLESNLKRKQKMLDWCKDEKKLAERTRSMLKTKKGANDAEIKLLGLIKEINQGYEYSGDGKVIVGRKCPDYINLKEMKIIELHSFYHRMPGVKEHRTAQGTIDYYNNYGYKTLVIQFEELFNEIEVKKKIMEFEGLI